MYLSARQRKILEILLPDQSEATIKEIADLLKVSERTAHRDLNGLEEVLIPFKLRLERKPGVGVRIEGEPGDRALLVERMSATAPADYTPEERQAVILLSLYEAAEPVKLFTLASDLKVTAGTVSNDLDHLESVLEDYQLRLSRKRGSGVVLIGTEANKRRAISRLITNHVDPYEYVSLVKQQSSKKKQAGNMVSARLLSLVNPDKLSIIEDRVERVREELPHDLADNAYIGLVVHLALAIERIENGDRIEFDKDYLEQLMPTKEYEAANRLLQELEKAFNLDIPEDEIGYITMHLMGAKLQVNGNYVIEESSVDTALQAKALILYVEGELHIELSQNTDLLNDLVAHLKPATYRLRQSMAINNPLLEDIQRDYHDLFALLESGVKEVFPDLHFPPDEIGYLVLHFASAILNDQPDPDVKVLVICSSGIGTAKILATRLKQTFPEIKEIENHSMFGLEKISDQYDLVISTIPLPDFQGRYVLVTPMLNESEVTLVKNALRHGRAARKLRLLNSGSLPSQKEANGDFADRLQAMHEQLTVFLSVLSAFRVYKLESGTTMDEVLLSACGELKKQNVIGNAENVYNALVKREEISGLGIPDTKLIFQHARSEDVRRPFFSIYSLKRPLRVKGMDGQPMDTDTVLIMLAPMEAQEAEMGVLSFLSSMIVEDERSIRLFEEGSEESIRHFLSGQFYKMLHDK